MELLEIKQKIRIIGNTKDIENIEEILSFGDLGKKINDVLDAVLLLKDSNTVEMLSQQFVGFKHGKCYSEDIIGLVTSMGLTKNEWAILKDEYPINSDLSEFEIIKINDYFIELVNER